MGFVRKGAFALGFSNDITSRRSYGAVDESGSRYAGRSAPQHVLDFPNNAKGSCLTPAMEVPVESQRIQQVRGQGEAFRVGSVKPLSSYLQRQQSRTGLWCGRRSSPNTTLRPSSFVITTPTPLAQQLAVSVCPQVDRFLEQSSLPSIGRGPHIASARRETGPVQGSESETSAAAHKVEMGNDGQISLRINPQPLQGSVAFRRPATRSTFRRATTGGVPQAYNGVYGGGGGGGNCGGGRGEIGGGGNSPYGTTTCDAHSSLSASAVSGASYTPTPWNPPAERQVHGAPGCVAHSPSPEAGPDGPPHPLAARVATQALTSPAPLRRPHIALNMVLSDPPAQPLPRGGNPSPVGPCTPIGLLVPLSLRDCQTVTSSTAAVIPVLSPNGASRQSGGLSSRLRTSSPCTSSDEQQQQQQQQQQEQQTQQQQLQQNGSHARPLTASLKPTLVSSLRPLTPSCSPSPRRPPLAHRASLCPLDEQDPASTSTVPPQHSHEMAAPLPQPEPQPQQHVAAQHPAQQSVTQFPPKTLPQDSLQDEARSRPGAIDADLIDLQPLVSKGLPEEATLEEAMLPSGNEDPNSQSYPLPKSPRTTVLPTGDRVSKSAAAESVSARGGQRAEVPQPEAGAVADSGSYSEGAAEERRDAEASSKSQLTVEASSEQLRVGKGAVDAKVKSCDREQEGSALHSPTGVEFSSSPTDGKPGGSSDEGANGANMGSVCLAQATGQVAEPGCQQALIRQSTSREAQLQEDGGVGVSPGLGAVEGSSASAGSDVAGISKELPLSDAPRATPPLPRRLPFPGFFTLRPSPPCGLLHWSPDAPASMLRPANAWFISDYKVQRKLHAGYASCVYKASCNHSGDDVVLKAYDLGSLSSFLRHQVLRELDIHSRLRHAGVVQLLAAFKEGDVLVMVQEYVQGGSLGRVRRKLGGRMTEFQALHLVLLPLLSTISYLHGSGIVHRDLKPENLLFTDGWQLKVCDYGVSVCLREERAVTRTGSREYMAPEVRACPYKVRPEDNKDNPTLAYTAAVDVWSLGSLLYELLVGFTPFPGGPPPFEAGKGGSAGKALVYPAELSPGARAFVQECMGMDPADRPTVHRLLMHRWIQEALEDNETDALSSPRSAESLGQ